MPIVRFAPSETDLIEANKLWLRQELWTRGNLLFFVCGAVIFALLALHFASDAGFGLSLVAAGMGAVTWLLAVSLILGIMRLWLPRRARHRFAQQKPLHSEVQLTWSEDGITFETESGYSRHAWDEFEKWAESRAVFILFYTDRLFSFVPKRALSAGEADELRSLLRRS